MPVGPIAPDRSGDRLPALPHGHMASVVNGRPAGVSEHRLCSLDLTFDQARPLATSTLARDTGEPAFESQLQGGKPARAKLRYRAASAGWNRQLAPEIEQCRAMSFSAISQRLSGIRMRPDAPVHCPTQVADACAAGLGVA